MVPPSVTAAGSLMRSAGASSLSRMVPVAVSPPVAKLPSSLPTFGLERRTVKVSSASSRVSWSVSTTKSAVGWPAAMVRSLPAAGAV